MKNILLITIALFTTSITNAQVLFSEDFDSYSAGHLNTDYTSTTVGQGGWLISGSNATAMVNAETGKGNVLSITSSGNNTSVNRLITFKQAQGVIGNLWKNRTVGNNVLKFEVEFYGADSFSAAIGILSQSATLINVGFPQNQNRIVGNYLDNTWIKHIVLKDYANTSFPYNIWIKTELFVDYNTKNVYFYIPTLNLWLTKPFSHNTIPEDIYSDIRLSSLAIVKIDNIKLTALKSVPPYVLSANTFLAQKFNLYPNPATNVVTITNNENRLVNQVAVYDVTGKLISTQSFNNETEIQLNVENLASGTYMLHLQTAEGTAVKKLVKK